MEENIRTEIAKYLESQGWSVVLVADHGVKKPDPASFKYEYTMQFLGVQRGDNSMSTVKGEENE